jgi:hypothetical protein
MRLAALLLASAAAEQTAQELFEQVRDKVLDNARRVPRYTCVQTIDRNQYRRRRSLDSTGYLMWRDRLRLDVAVLDGRETFAWAGARQFETTDIEQLTSSGSSGSGDFATFLSSVFGLETTRISLLREEKSPTDLSALFGFDVPVNTSRYVYRSHGRGERRVIGYHGTFLVDERNAELKRLTVEADHFPAGEEMYRVEDTMDYHRVKIGDGEFLLPETSKMNIVFYDGQESRNETHYSNCREYGAESSISFDDAGDSSSSADTGNPAQRKLPPNLLLQIGLKSPIRSETAAAGDAVTAVILRDVKGVARANDIVHGRILRLEQFVSPSPRWILAIRFNTIEHNGVEQALDLTPIDDGNRPRRYAILTERRPDGGGVFIFAQSGNLVLDQKFHSEWETR